MDRKVMLELIFRSSTNRELRKEQLCNIFGVNSVDDIPEEKLIAYCNKYYCTKEG